MNKFIKGFSFAFQGIVYALKTQINMRFHLMASVVVVGAGLFFKLNSLDWIILLFCVALVWAAELFNTAIEALTDLVTKEIHPLAKVAKDCAAGAVLVLSILSLIVGIIIFSQYIF